MEATCDRPLCSVLRWLIWVCRSAAESLQRQDKGVPPSPAPSFAAKMRYDARRRRSPTFLEKGTTERQNKEGSACQARFVVRDLYQRTLGLLNSWAQSSPL